MTAISDRPMPIGRRQSTPGVAGGGMTLAGWWNLLVSLPLIFLVMPAREVLRTLARLLV